MENKFKLIEDNISELKTIDEFYGKSLEEIYNIYRNNFEKFKKCTIEGVISISSVIPVSLVSPVLGCGLLALALSNLVSCYTNLVKENSLLRNYYNYYMCSFEYQEVYNLYLKVLNDLSCMFNRLDWDNEMKIFSGYSYLFKNGYLSENHEFYYSTLFDSCYGLYGCGVISGKGNDIHINSMLTDLLNINQYSACNLSMSINGEDISFLNDLKMLVEEVDYDDNFDFKNHTNHLNHLATLFGNEFHSYVMDACNDTVFYVCKEGNIYNKYSEFFCKCEKMFNYEKKINISDILKSTSKEEIDKLIKDYYNVLQMCDECRDVFEKFYREHEELYGEVVSKRKVLVKEYEKYNICRNL